jgi:hypothetical protein
VTCFPGKVTRNKTCVSLLAYTSKLRYTLAVKIEILTSTVINATVEELLESVKNYIKNTIKLQISNNVSIEKIALMSPVRCQKSFTILKEVFLYWRIFFHGIVHRDEMEQNLIDFTESSADWDLSNKLDWVLRVKVSRHYQSLSLHSFPQRAFRKNHCFINSDSGIHASKIHKSVYVSPLLTCFQFVLKDNGSEIDQANAGLEYPFADFSNASNNFHISYSGQRCMCVKAKQLVGSDDDNLPLRIITVVFLVMSLICLFITFVTYCTFSSLRTLPGINNMGLVVSLFLAQILMIIRPIFKSTVLSVVSALLHFSWLSTFFWLQVCSFHMFRVFTAKGRSEFIEIKSTKRAKLYSCYTFGSSTFIVTTNIVVSLIVTDGTNTGYDDVSTLMTYKTAFIATLIIPLILACITNTIFYILTAYNIYSTPKLERSSGNRVHFSVYVKLFTLTGLSWVLQIIDTFLETSVLSYCVAVLNGLQGFFIFVSYICNERVWNMYRDVCCKFSAFQNPSTLPSKTDTTTM